MSAEMSRDMGSHENYSIWNSLSNFQEGRSHRAQRRSIEAVQGIYSDRPNIAQWTHFVSLFHLGLGLA
jgi:hypothetical protein